jgi:hypothetical protein
MTTRIAGKRGRLPAKPQGERFAIRWAAEYATLPLPAAVYPVDVTGGIAAWGMDGNDEYGDCAWAAREHYKMAKAAAGHETEAFETADALVAEYLAYDHGQDIGANLADVLLSWYKAGKILGFAPVDHTDPAAVDAAVQAFHGCYAGVSLTGDANDLFGQGKPWTVADGQQPDPNDGHCIVKVGAGQAGSGGPPFEPDTWVTWGALQRSSQEWTAACLDEAWVIITQEDAAAASLDIAALRADIDALHGTGGDSMDPVPAPAPSRTMLAKLAAFVREVSADSELSHVVSWLGSHGL